MLSYMSDKFTQEQAPHSHEPRAALFLNRYTRTAAIMFATCGVTSILGIRGEQLVGKSFYFCIAENCLSDAVQCLERAKANDSIAYLRFWFRNPLLEDGRNQNMSTADGPSSDEAEDDGGVRIIRPQAGSDVAIESSDSSPSGLNSDPTLARVHETYEEGNSRSSSGNSTDFGRHDSDRVVDTPAIQRARSSASSISHRDPARLDVERIEVEAFVSCTSDGLVVILRRARPLIPQAVGVTEPINYDHGVFAAPWAFGQTGGDGALNGGVPVVASPLVTEPDNTPVMSAIRDVAVFAWSLTGINGAMVDLANGRPSGEALPPGGLPIWDPSANVDPENESLYNGFSGSAHRPINQAQADCLEKVDGTDSVDDRMASPIKEDTKSPKGVDESSSEVGWKRAPTMPEWRRPPRRAHRDAFGSEADTKEMEGDDRASQTRRRRLDG
jgi:hypothetical protein